jgi:serine phosphatase RsbU (regulator of sigma subunit)
MKHLSQAQSLAFEEDLASKIWRSVVPETLNKIAHYKTWLVSRPAKHVGGDFHLSTGSWMIVGDVSGKGIPAALLTGMFIAALKLAVRDQDPGAALQMALYSELDKAEMFTTLVAVQLGADGWIDYLNMGHPPLLIRQKATGEVQELKASAPPMGTLAMATYPVKSFKLEPGDSLCLYTDGIIEAECPHSPDDQFGIERLKALLEKHEDPEAAFAAIQEAHKDWLINDDYTLVMLEYKPESGWLEERLERR